MSFFCLMCRIHKCYWGHVWSYIRGLNEQPLRGVAPTPQNCTMKKGLGSLCEIIIILTNRFTKNLIFILNILSFLRLLKRSKKHQILFWMENLLREWQNREIIYRGSAFCYYTKALFTHYPILLKNNSFISYIQKCEIRSAFPAIRHSLIQFLNCSLLSSMQ